MCWLILGSSLIALINLIATSNSSKLRVKTCCLYIITGTDEAALIKVIGYRSNDQMLEVVKTYKTMFGRDLIADLKSETSGGFKKLLVGLCMVPADFDAMSLHNAIKVGIA
jgi:hypothetical protein